MKQIVLDFDGIFSQSMLYDMSGKALKEFHFGIRHAFELLNAAGFDKPLIITGDSTESGIAITKNFLHNIDHDIVKVSNHKKPAYLIESYNIDEIIYLGDDIYDVEIFKYFNHTCTINPVHQILENFAGEVFINLMDFAEWAINKFSKTSFMQVIVDKTSNVKLISLLKNINATQNIQLTASVTSSLEWFESTIYKVNNKSSDKPTKHLMIDCMQEVFTNINRDWAHDVIVVYTEKKYICPTYLRDLNELHANIWALDQDVYVFIKAEAKKRNLKYLTVRLDLSWKNQIKV